MEPKELRLEEEVSFKLNQFGWEAFHRYRDNNATVTPPNIEGRVRFTLAEAFRIFGPVLATGQSPFAEEIIFYHPKK